MYQDILSFKGEFREYQQRVLDKSKGYLQDKRFHIVAAPGSGKTTIGIEMIRRIGEACLILSPNVTIRQQWIERIVSGFLVEGVDKDAWISHSLHHPRPIISVTYQALHSCLQKYQGIIKEQEEEEEVDFHDIDIFEIIEKQNIKIICLDEAHHLRNEWWGTLEKIVQKYPDLIIISLTATPPYDSSATLWKRYMDLCGSIDEEIATPELVMEGSLCPHQDYVYFNYPTKEEMSVLSEYQKGVEECITAFKDYEPLINAVKNHPGLVDARASADSLLENPEYLVSVLVFLQYHNISYPSYFNRLLDTKKNAFPPLQAEWLEKLLQGILFDDKESYCMKEEWYHHLLYTLKKHGCVQKKKINLVTNDKITKMLISSKGKLHSIKEIVKAEYQSLNGDLRLLVLCDYIKKETTSLIGSSLPINEMGAIPIFETIRREKIQGIKLGVLSGGIIIIPTSVQTRILEKLSMIGKIATIHPIGGTEYCIVKHTVNNGDIVKIVTEIFHDGHINTLVGTKSLLGEGWDSPCINALILASFVGSFMLSNQMRGRAIRTLKDNPNKVSNIWHLVCLDPPLKSKVFKQDGTLNNHKGGYDLALLHRRFEGFLGLHHEENIVENGIGRLGITKEVPSRREVEKRNQQMLQTAMQRDKLQKRWHAVLRVIGKDFEIEDVNEINLELLKRNYVFFNLIKWFILYNILMVVSMIFQISFRVAVAANNIMLLLCSGIILLLFVLISTHGMKLYAIFTPEKRLQKIANALLKTLLYTGHIHTNDCVARIEKVIVSRDNGIVNEIAKQVYLKGATTREKTQFSVSMNDIFDVIENPRYLIIATKERRGINRYYTVPDIIAKKKESAEYFRKQLLSVLGPCELVYTRNPEGRKVLLKARTRSYGYRNLKVVDKKKKVKGKYE